MANKKVDVAVRKHSQQKSKIDAALEAKEKQVHEMIGRKVADHLYDIHRSLNEIRSMVAPPPASQNNGAVAHSVELSKRLEARLDDFEQRLEYIDEVVTNLTTEVEKLKLRRGVRNTKGV